MCDIYVLMVVLECLTLIIFSNNLTSS